MVHAKKSTMVWSGQHPLVIPVRSVRSVHLPRKTIWKQRLGTTANRTGALSSPVRSVHFAPFGRAVEAPPPGNPGPIGPVGPLRQENAMETRAWHHRNWTGRCPLRSDRSTLRHPGAVEAPPPGNPGPIGPVGPLRQENAMETKTWHHRQSDRGNVRSGPIGPIRVILRSAR